MSKTLVDKWKSMLDNVDCHPELREEAAKKLQCLLSNTEGLAQNGGKFNIKEFGKKLKEITKPYDRRDNTLR